MDEALSATDITVKKVLSDLEITRVKALGDGRYTAAVRCMELQGKYLGMFSNRIEHVQSIEDVSTESLLNLVQEISESGGIDVSMALKGCWQ